MTKESTKQEILAVIAKANKEKRTVAVFSDAKIMQLVKKAIKEEDSEAAGNVYFCLGTQALRSKFKTPVMLAIYYGQKLRQTLDTNNISELAYEVLEYTEDPNWEPDSNTDSSSDTSADSSSDDDNESD